MIPLRTVGGSGPGIREKRNRMFITSQSYRLMRCVDVVVDYELLIPLALDVLARKGEASKYNKKALS